MAKKEFKVRSTKTGEVITIKGESLDKALTAEGLNPAIWQEFNDSEPSEPEEPE